MALSSANLPAPDADLRETIRFAAAHDPTAEFRARWGADYPAQAMDLWGRLLADFKTGAAPSPGDPDDLLLALNYDIAAGPYMAIPPGQVRRFHQWLVDSLRVSLPEPVGRAIDQPQAHVFGHDAVLAVDASGIRLRRHDGSEHVVSFADCRANLATRFPELVSSQPPLVGFRDRSAEVPWIEFLSTPPTRVTFQPGAPVQTVLGGRFVVRSAPAGFSELQAAIAQRGFAVGDLG